MGSNSVTKTTIGKNSFQIDCSGGTGDTYGILGGSVDGSNTTFTVSLGSYVSGSLEVQLNGQLLTQGSGEDWEETTPASGTFTLSIAPEVGDILIVKYQYQTVTTGNADTLDGHHSTDFVTNTVAGEFENKIIDGDKNTLQDISYSSIKSTSRSGSDATLITGTKGTSGDLAQWNADGDLVDSKTPPTGDIVGTTDTQALTNKTIDGDNNTLQDIASESLKSTVAFGARVSSAQTISDTTWTKVACNYEDFDLGSRYDNATNYRFTAPYNGVYHFDGQTYLESLADGDRIIVELRRNGDTFKRGTDTRVGGATAGGAVVSATVSLSANDYIELYVYYDGTGTKSTGTTYNQFSGFLIGKTA